MKKVYIFTFILLLSVLLVACATTQPTPQEPAQTTSLQQESVQKQESVQQEGTQSNSNKQQSVVNKPASTTNEVVKDPTLSQTVSHQKITKEDAWKTALSHAKISQSQAKFVENEYDWEKGVGIYEIEFRVGSDEYEYHIHAKTKEVLKAEKNDMDLLASQEITPISKEKAKSLVIQHAKVPSTKIRDYKIELETKQGKTVYEIEFEESMNEYKYTVDAQTGKILYSKKTID